MVGKPPTYFADVWAHEVGQRLAYGAAVREKRKT